MVAREQRRCCRLLHKESCLCMQILVNLRQLVPGGSSSGVAVGVLASQVWLQEAILPGSTA